MLGFYLLVFVFGLFAFAFAFDSLTHIQGEAGLAGAGVSVLVGVLSVRLFVCQLCVLVFSLSDFSSVAAAVAASLWHLVDFDGLLDIFLFLLAFLLNLPCLQLHFLYTDLHLFLTILPISYNH